MSGQLLAFGVCSRHGPAREPFPPPTSSSSLSSSQCHAHCPYHDKISRNNQRPGMSRRCIQPLVRCPTEQPPAHRLKRATPDAPSGRLGSLNGTTHSEQLLVTSRIDAQCNAMHTRTAKTMPCPIFLSSRCDDTHATSVAVM